MKISSRAFVQGGSIPRQYTCQGEDRHPPLEFSDIPEGCRSLVLILEDPDVPEWVRKDRLWIHWVLYNIDPNECQIEENKKVGVLGKNTSGEMRYMGPCPPDRKHRYFFKLYALDTILDRPPGGTKTEVEKAMQGHVLKEAHLMGTYEKT